MEWERAQEWERRWHGQCVNSYGEEEKHLVYAVKMGLTLFHDGKSPYNIDLAGKSVIDIGGGPCSLLLKCVNGGNCLVLDPCEYPRWTIERYREAGITVARAKGEELNRVGFAEAWLYNCCQHVEDPELVIRNAQRAAKVIRLFEWIDTVANEGHPHILTELLLNEWLDGYGKVEELNLPTLKGRCYYGVFRGL